VQSGQKTAFNVANAKVAQAASGIDVNSGSAAATRSSMTSLGQTDQATIRTNAARRAYGFETEAAGKDSEAIMDETASVNAKKSGTLNAISSILGTASSVSSKWLQGSQAGIGSSRGGIDLYGPDFTKTGTY
jgi:hypothetical protein